MDKVVVKPKDDRVLVNLSEDSQQMYGSIVVADLGHEKPQIGEVIAVGPGRITEHGNKVECTVNIGDKVLIPKIGYFKVPMIKDKDYILIQDKEILAVIEEQKD
jgi:chaperonin GroES